MRTIPPAPPRQFRLAEHDLKGELADRKGDENDVDPLQPRHGQRDQDRGEGRRHTPHGDREPGVHAERLGRDGGGVDTHAEEGQVAEVEDACVAERQVPVRRDHGIDESDDEEVARVAVGHHRGHEQEHDEGRG
ncbi:MAG: hypothetical protein AAFW69_06965, partial [Pseudomonadota bacterium]